MEDYTNFSRFFYELGMLQRVQREGWKLLGVTHPESVAEHSLRSAQIAYVLAILEDHPSPETVCSMLVFHDIGECRIGDVQKVANRYIQSDERRAVSDQLEPLNDIGTRIFRLWDEIESQDSKKGIIAKDADLLELALTACEYKKQGFTAADDWLEKTRKRLNTSSAKKLLESFIETDPISWWDGLKQLKKHHMD
ncbi:MAG TPA: HD domain-containing protein [Candidatus Thermoplasmatota archaeon]|nr:HD domain-containing protein [Candidatus Thermoplasmatota archaeon]